MKKLSKRNFLKQLGTATVASSFPLAANLAAFNANAATTSDYKALVCVFFYGGLDCHDTVIPYDTSSYNRWADIRAPLLNISGSKGYGGSRNRNRLLKLNNINNIGSQKFALPENMAGMHKLFSRKNASIIGNVGPLREPMDRGSFLNKSGLRPPRLFSHNDQQSIWFASEPEGASIGWGGRFADMMLASDANPNATFTSVSAAGSSVFLEGDISRQFHIGTDGTITINAIENGLSGAPNYSQILSNHLNAKKTTATNLFERDMQNMFRYSMKSNDELARVFETASPLNTNFPKDNDLASQLAVVAKMISLRDPLEVKRQVFFVAASGFDTHSKQPSSLPQLQKKASDAISSFYASTEELGIQNNVTLFTSSDFGRTLQVNADGTDHGWGGHHMIVGGAVKGGQILGSMPTTGFNHEQDSGRGRLIPTSSVQQFAAPMGRWFGLSESELREALPGLNNFDSRQLDGIFT